MLFNPCVRVVYPRKYYHTASCLCWLILHYEPPRKFAHMLSSLFISVDEVLTYILRRAYTVVCTAIVYRMLLWYFLCVTLPHSYKKSLSLSHSPSYSPPLSLPLIPLRSHSLILFFPHIFTASHYLMLFLPPVPHLSWLILIHFLPALHSPFTTPFHTSVICFLFYTHSHLLSSILFPYPTVLILPVPPHLCILIRPPTLPFSPSLSHTHDYADTSYRLLVSHLASRIPHFSRTSFHTGSPPHSVIIHFTPLSYFTSTYQRPFYSPHAIAVS